MTSFDDLTDSSPEGPVGIPEELTEDDSTVDSDSAVFDPVAVKRQLPGDVISALSLTSIEPSQL